MKSNFFKSIMLCMLIIQIYASCKKVEEPYVTTGIIPIPIDPNTHISPSPSPPPPVITPCNIRPAINVKLIPIGNLSIGRANLKSAAAGNKILFAGGWTPGNHSTRVDIFDTLTKTWSVTELSSPYRDGMAVATVGDKILFAGGGNYDWTDVTSRVDIYNTATNTWSIAELSVARSDLTAVTLGKKVFFAGGAIWNYVKLGSSVVDIYDEDTNSWTTATLSEGRYELTATAVAKKIYFTGGIHNIYSISNKIDVFDSETNTWSTTQLHEPKTSHSAIEVDNKIFWAGGAKTSYHGGYIASSVVEIKDVITGISTFDCITPKARFDAVIKDNNIIFFTGNNGLNTQIDIFNTITNTWSIGKLPFSIQASSIINVNNIIIVAGGMDNPSGPYYNQVWRLDF